MKEELTATVVEEEEDKVEAAETVTGLISSNGCEREYRIGEEGELDEETNREPNGKE